MPDTAQINTLMNVAPNGSPLEQATTPVTPPPKRPTGPAFKTAILLERTNLATKFNEYKFKTAEPFDFSAGQYVSVKVAPTAIRSYSIATRYDLNHFDLLVDTRPGGPGSQYFDKIQVNDSMPFLGPFGKFVFDPNDGAEIVLGCATGSGLSAVRSIIDRLLLENNFTKPLKLYFGLTFVEEIYWKDHFEELAQKYPNFSYQIAILKPDDTWKGAQGFITDLIIKDFPDASKCSVYICGHPAMISAVSDAVIKNGTPPTRVYTEKFV